MIFLIFQLLAEKVGRVLTINYRRNEEDHEARSEPALRETTQEFRYRYVLSCRIWRQTLGPLT